MKVESDCYWKMITSISPQSLDNDIVQLQPATWSDYLTYRDDEIQDALKLFFDKNYLLIETGREGINHSQFCELLTMMLGFWFSHHPEEKFSLLNRCQLEKPKTQAAAPDLVLYLGDDYPTWQIGERRYINLAEFRVPDLVGEVGDTTLAKDLDEKKHLYAQLGIREYWVIDVRGKRVITFILADNGIYQEVDISEALNGLKISLINQTLQRLETETNGMAAIWFSQQVATLLKDNSV
ncbi:MAG: Uma2 family endonuclease [Crocosphaera sp.]